MSTTGTRPFSALQQEVRNLITMTKVAAAPDATDPTLQGKVSVGAQPDAAPSKAQMPPNGGMNTPGGGVKDPFAPGLATGEGNTAIPAQDPVDASVTSPTSPVVDGATTKSATDMLHTAAGNLRKILDGSASAPATPAPVAPVSKTASPTVTLDPVDPWLHAKIARDLTGCEQGVALLNEFYTAQVGVEAANQILKVALSHNSQSNQSMNLFEKLAGGDAQVRREAEIGAFIDSLPQHVKTAAALATRCNELNLSHLKTQDQVAQYDQGFQDAVHICKLAAAGAPDPAVTGGGEGEPSIEEVVQMLMEMGVTEEEIVALLEQAAQQAQGAGGGAPGGGAPAEGPVAPAMA